MPQVLSYVNIIQPHRSGRLQMGLKSSQAEKHHGLSIGRVWSTLLVAADASIMAFCKDPPRRVKPMHMHVHACLRKRSMR